MDSFIMTPHFGVEIVAFTFAINSRLIFVAGLRKYRPLSVPLLWEKSIHSGVACVWKGAHSPVIIPVPTVTRFPVYADVHHTSVLTGTKAI